MIWGGLRVIFTLNALQKTEERLFPVSKNRSKRIHKKLVKRFGGEFRMKPAMWVDKSKNIVYAHPAYEAELKRAIKENNQHAQHNLI